MFQGDHSYVEKSQAERALTHSSVGLRLDRVCSDEGEEGIGMKVGQNQDVSLTVMEMNPMMHRTPPDLYPGFNRTKVTSYRNRLQTSACTKPSET